MTWASASKTWNPSRIAPSLPFSVAALSTADRTKRALGWSAGGHGGLLAQVRRHERRAVGELGRRSFEHDPALDHHRRPAADLERHDRVLLDEEQRRPGCDLGEGGEERPCDLRRQPERRLVEQQQPRPGHERTADRDHLLLAPRERPADPSPDRSEGREEVVDLVDAVAIRAAATGRGADEQVLVHAERREDAPAFRDVDEPAPRPALDAEPVAVQTVEADRAAIRREPRDRAQGG